MAFAFGAASPAPSTGFSFGANNPAPFGAGPAPAAPAFGAAPTTTFGTPSPAPGTFGTATAPAPLFGQAPASGFGAAPAPAFGQASTPAFGAATTPSAFNITTPAPGTGFGATATAPSFGSGGFGTAPAAPAAFGGFGTNTTTPQYGSQAPTFNAYQAPQQPSISGSTPYASLSTEEKKAIDALHEALMQHKRTMAHVETISPRLLSSTPKVAADCAAGNDLPITLQIARLEARATKVQQLIITTLQQAEELKKRYEASAMQAIMHGRWPVEATATRRGVSLTKSKPASDDNVQSKLQQLLDRQLAHVDRVERMPSPYLWQIVEDLELRISNIQVNIETLAKQLERHRFDSAGPVDVVYVIELQNQALFRTMGVITKLHRQMELVRQRYRLVEKGDNVLDKADQEAREHERRMLEQVHIAYLQAASRQNTTAPSAAPTPFFGGTPAPTTAPTGLFGNTTSTPSSAPAPNLFGTNPAAPTPAPGGSIFGNPPTPAVPAFGAPPATPAFGAAPAPVAFGGAPPAPVPVATLGTSTPKNKSKSRSGSRRTR